MKRFIDIAFSLAAIIVLSPIMLFISWQIGRKLGSPILFRQSRAGINGNCFTMIKFRSMLNTADEKGNALPDCNRMTPFGHFLRSTSIDELPELWNVLKGDMSLVGPRPLLMEYLPLYSQEQNRRHEMRPGITGWAQVNGRNAISWEDKFKLDVWYVENQSIWLDFKILFLTVKRILTRDGISAQGEATMSRFMGTHQKEDTR